MTRPEQTSSPIYLDCNATTPVDPRVADLVLRFMTEDFGNASSRTHDFGVRAKRAVQSAREQVAKAAGARADEVYFTSGATESNNLVLLGLADWAREQKRCHIISTSIEHKAVIEPLQFLASQGFQVDFLKPTPSGWIEPDAIRRALRPDTALVSVMHVNNETGVIQPLEELADVLKDHPAYFHADGAQGFGKLEGLESSRIDFISISGHKLFAPKGIGALISRRRQSLRPPLSPLTFGGGQERGIRPGTLAVPMIAGLGLAAELAWSERAQRRSACLRFGAQLFEGLAPLRPVVNGDTERMAPHVANLSFDGVDSEAALVALKGVLAVSNGSACTSHSYAPSHVLQAMGLSQERIAGALRFSWSHATPDVPWHEVVSRLASLGSAARLTQ